MLNGGCEAAFAARVRVGWVRFRECGELLLGIRFWLKMKSCCCCRCCYPTPSEGWENGGQPWSPRSRATLQGPDQKS